MVETYLLVRSRQDPDTGAWGPRADDLAPYQYSGEDVTARASNLTGPLFLSSISRNPQVLVWRIRLSNADALAMSTDPKVWMLTSRQYNPDTNETIQDNWDSVYTEGERATRITQLGNFTDFDAAQIEAWWTPDKRYSQVASKLMNYLGSIN